MVKYRSKQYGFTLIELLVVISIISLLASVVVASFSDARKSARDAQRFIALTQIQTALEAYRNKHGEYPDTGNSWFTWCTHDADPTSRDLEGPNGYIPNLAPAHISRLPLDPNGCIPRGEQFNYGHFGGFIYRSNGADYKFSTDWSAEGGTACKPGTKFWDPNRGEGGSGAAPRPSIEIEFCSVYTDGGRLW